MQPEEIIQQKEWKELTEEERYILQSLAADEQEYNLLKKMMMIADEAAIDVPVIAPVVQTYLHQSMITGSGSKKGRVKWYYAAAAIFFIAVVSTWIMVRDKKDDPAKTDLSMRIPVLPLDPTIIITNDTPYDRFIGHGQREEHKKKSHSEVAVIDKKPQPPEIINPRPDKKNFVPDDHPISYTAISTLIKDDSELMAFVTEVY